MKRTLVSMLAMLAMFGPTRAQTLGGVERLACEALLCLSSGTRPSECSPALAHYFGIQKRIMPDTIEARFSFLRMCPMGMWPGEMTELADAISRGAGRCTADELNLLLRFLNSNQQEEIRSTMPDYCRVYFGHGYTDLGNLKPKYVGQPRLGGRWVEAEDYDEAVGLWDRYLQDWYDGRLINGPTIWWYPLYARKK